MALDPATAIAAPPRSLLPEDARTACADLDLGGGGAAASSEGRVSGEPLADWVCITAAAVAAPAVAGSTVAITDDSLPFAAAATAAAVAADADADAAAAAVVVAVATAADAGAAGCFPIGACAAPPSGGLVVTTAVPSASAGSTSRDRDLAGEIVSTLPLLPHPRSPDWS